MERSPLVRARYGAARRRTDRRSQCATAISDAADKFAGVARVGLLAEQLDRAVQLRLTSLNEHDPHRIFLCDLESFNHAWGQLRYSDPFRR